LAGLPPFPSYLLAHTSFGRSRGQSFSHLQELYKSPVLMVGNLLSKV
jgi:hypothetical protein